MIECSVTAAKYPDAGRELDAGALPPAAFYCVSSGRYFLGAVALVNSLRLLGHTEPIFVLDCGLSPAQRELLSQEATLVPAPGDTTPFLLKTIAPLTHPAEVMVLVDADIIVTRPLTELIERASHGRVLAVEHGQDRFFDEWGELLGGTARHRRYVSSSLVLLGGEPGRNAIRLMDELQGRIDIERTPFASPRPDFSFVGDDFREMGSDHPFFFADQDVLNAVLAAGIDPDRVEVLDRRLEATVPFTGLRVVDEEALRCAYEDGIEPHAVHQILTAKPWLEPTTPGVYQQLLLRLLLGRDVAIRIPQRDLPLHLQPGVIAGAKRWYRGPFSAGVRTVRDRVRKVGGPVEG
jgi:hypothetical protein